MRLHLPDVTLVVVSDVEQALTALAIRDTTARVRFGACRWLQDGIGHTLQGAEFAMWYTVPQIVSTSHMLFMQYDGWVLDAKRWDPHWLTYDYIGAPWPWHTDDLNVGNGGFSLRSLRLMTFLRDHAREFPLHSPEDDTLCRRHRPLLEAAGFHWAPDHIASEFAFERDAPRPTFGFHGIFNWPHILTPDALVYRKALASPYARSKVEWKELPDG